MSTLKLAGTLAAWESDCVHNAPTALHCTSDACGAWACVWYA